MSKIYLPMVLIAMVAAGFAHATSVRTDKTAAVQLLMGHRPDFKIAEITCVCAAIVDGMEEFCQAQPVDSCTAGGPIAQYCQPQCY